MKRLLARIRRPARLSKKPATPSDAPVSTHRPCRVAPAPGVLGNASTRRPVGGSQVSAPLEKLPPEVRRHILSTLGLEELRALVLASPVFHQQYRLDRRYILRGCLETTLRSVVIDACAVNQSGSPGFSDTRTTDKVKDFLGAYRQQRALARHSSLTEALSDDEVMDMLAFHSRIVKPMADAYVKWALSRLAIESGLPRSPGHLSIVEETRVMRALYRFQLCCNLFGKGRHGTPGQPRLGFRSVDILDKFLCIFGPWQIEEIACIYAFAETTYSQVFRDIAWDVDENNPKFDGQRPPTPDGAFDLGNSWTRDCLLKGTLSRGLEMLHTLDFKIRDHPHLVSTMQREMAWPAGYFLGNEALGEGTLSSRRRHHPSVRDEKEARRDPLPFAGDVELDDDRELYPPLAWTLLWNGTYSNSYGYYTIGDIRLWGYVMWDAARIERTGAKDVLARQWEAEWGGDDPRDNVH